jgi:hypothetical protein
MPTQFERNFAITSKKSVVVIKAIAAALNHSERMAPSVLEI